MNKHNQKHLTISDRLYIEQELLQGTSFKAIAKVLHKDPTTISKEVKRARTLIPHDRFARKCRLCHFYSSCSDKNLCRKIKEHPYFNNCNASCKKCYRWNPQDECPNFLEFTCNKCAKAPYVCNACPKERTCFLERYIYNAKKAQRLYEQTLSKSREGINMTPEELQELNDLISPLVLKGQPLSHIFAVHADEIPVCRRTLYNYLDQRIFQARNIDLPRRVRYKKRKKKSEPKLEVYRMNRCKMTPMDFGYVINGHPDSLIPTARAKMKNARLSVKYAEVDISGHLIECPRLRNSEFKLDQNRQRVREFVDRISTYSKLIKTNGDLCFKRIEASDVADLVHNFQSMEWHYYLDSATLSDHIKSEYSNDWMVYIIINLYIFKKWYCRNFLC